MGQRGGSKPGERRGGRQKGTPNRVTREIRALAVGYGPDCIAGLAEIAIGPKTRSANEMTRLAAIRELLDRGYGRPAQSLMHSGAIENYDLTKLTDEELHAMYEILRKATPDVVGDVD